MRPSGLEPTIMFTHDKVLNLIHGRKIRPPPFRSSVLCGFRDAWDASDELTWVRDGSRMMVSSRPACPIILHPLGAPFEFATSFLDDPDCSFPWLHASP